MLECVTLQQMFNYLHQQPRSVERAKRQDTTGYWRAIGAATVGRVLAGVAEAGAEAETKSLRFDMLPRRMLSSQISRRCPSSPTTFART